ncbi:MAG TPA: hypothetical protein IAA58_07745 [Candidatus Gallacutalibacter stercoravium]|nr:hypothetical protein [Candidatus Gallacutalibacter stercoravium]
MPNKRSKRLGKRLLKVLAFYAVFLLLGLLLSFIPARQLGLLEESYFNLKIFFILLGPIYSILIAKIVLTFIGVSHLRNADNTQTISGPTGDTPRKGLRRLEQSKRYLIKSNRFLAKFIPVCFYLLILELMTLFVSIVSFAPLSLTASNLFIFLIALTALLLLLVPLTLSLGSGYQEDKARQKIKLAREMQKATQSEYLVLETDPVRRKQYLRLPKLLFLLICPGCFLISGFVLYLTKNFQYLFAIQVLRQPFIVCAAASFFLFLPLLMYWLNCSGTSKVQRIYLAQNQLYYTGYSGSMEERVEFTFALIHLKSCRVKKRTICIQGQFTKITHDAYGSRQKDLLLKTLWIPRTFPLQQEQILLDFLHRATTVQ